MDIEIRKLTPDLLDDWLEFFDSTAFTDDDSWAGCYCMCYHWTEELNAEKSWNCTKEDAPYNRRCAVSLIKSGKMQGYLAYADGKVVGWCNANDRSAYKNVNFTPADDDGKRVKSIVCFCIAPDKRGMGIASDLLERVCTDAAADCYDYVEAYPFMHNEHKAYHGPQVMYEKHGFEKHSTVGPCGILRKKL